MRPNFETRDLPFRTEDLSGVSVFYKDDSAEIFHTYSCYARGDEGGLGTYFYLDLTPKGRAETGPHHNPAMALIAVVVCSGNGTMDTPQFALAHTVLKSE
jgi:predicted dithiol-disulfide oxidoreductase (DUF899 family)